MIRIARKLLFCTAVICLSATFLRIPPSAAAADGDGVDEPPSGFSGEEPARQVDVPIIMYHNITRHAASLGALAITPDQFEADLRHIRTCGYTTVGMTDLIAFVYAGGPLPEKPIVLTFDDGHYNVYRYAFPLLQEYGMKSVVSILGRVTDTYSESTQTGVTFPHLTWTQVKEMADSKLVEIQNHSYDMHNQKSGAAGALRRSGESREQYRERLYSDISHLQTRVREMIGAEPTTFAYPFGARNNETEALIREFGFAASLACYKGVNRLTVGDPDCLYGLKRNIRPHGASTWKVFSAVGVKQAESAGT